MIKKTKRCNSCDKNKLLYQFEKNDKNGYFWNCFDCRKKIRTKTKWKPEEKKCVVCKCEFITKQINQVYCSPDCCLKSQSFKWLANNVEKARGRYLKLRFEVFKRDNFTCQYCGRNVKEDKIKLHCDHINPKSKGGKDFLNNLITSCSECNLGKRDVLLN